MPSYVFDPSTETMVDKHLYYARKHEEAEARVSSLPMPYIRGDLKPYISPVTGKPVEGRAARREDLARSGCREVDPSEKPKDGYVNYEFCQKHRLPFRNGDIPPPMTQDKKAWAKEKRAKAKQQKKLFDMGRAAAAADKIDPDLAKFKRGNTKSAPIFKNNTVKSES